MISKSSLLELLQCCRKCGQPAKTELRRTTGGATVKAYTSCGHCSCDTVWRSSPMVEGTRIAEVDLLTSASILFGGCSIRKSLRLFSVMKIPVISESTFHQHQSKYLHSVSFSVFVGPIV
jgi:hypothetical protein